MLRTPTAIAAEAQNQSRSEAQAVLPVIRAVGEVTSSVTYWPASDAVKLFVAAPMDGSVAQVTADSLHGEVTGAGLTTPLAFTRLRNSVSVAWEIWMAVVPPGSEPRSNASRAVSPLPTYRFAMLPKFVVAQAALT